MDNKKGKLSVNLEYDEAQAIPLALHEMHMARSDRRLRWTCLSLCICWAASLVIAVALFVVLWLQYDYVDVSTTEYSGVYNLTDSEGNVITSDLTPEDVIHIMETLNGDGKEDTGNSP